MTAPNLKITRLYIRGLGPIRSLDLPEQGLGWDGVFPDVLLLGGANGSGKTTLLEFLFSALALFEEKDFFKSYLGPHPFQIPVSLLATDAEFDLCVELNEFTKWTLDKPGATQIIRFYSSDHNPDTLEKSYGFRSDRGQPPQPFSRDNASLFARFAQGAEHGFPATMLAGLPGVIYLSSERRGLFTFHKKAKMFSETEEQPRFAQRWQHPSKWEESLEARLYSARWKDLNLKEEGKPERATHFATYAKAFSDFWGNTKSLVWSEGELFVEIKQTKEQHPLSALSSGEKQIMVMVSELLAGWRPGSIILIDEPELHLHTAWQTRLWELLIRWQKERGGQVIVATQSNHLFRIAEPSSVALLGRDPL